MRGPEGFIHLLECRWLRKHLEIAHNQLRLLSAFHDEHIAVLKDSFDLRIHARRGKMTLQGEDENVALCEQAIQTLVRGVDRGEPLKIENVRSVCDFYLTNPQNGHGNGHSNGHGNGHGHGNGKNAGYGSMVAGQSEMQNEYLVAMRRSTITFGIGPAGTGKTYLGVGMAAQYLLGGQVERIVLVRPAVEAGEKLGFLPGDLKEKIRPYLLPLYDALRVFLGPARLERYLETEVIEIAPLAYMRGRTLDNSFLILDEAQNTTVEQMKMFLTRLGRSSRAVITGDTSQVDLPEGVPSGLIHARKVLTGIHGIEFVELTAADVMRHPVVVDIIKAYSRQPS